MDVDDRDEPGHDGLEALNLAPMGLVPAIHVDAQGTGAWEKRDRSRPNRRREPTARRSRAGVDDRDEPGHDGIAVEMAATLGVEKFPFFPCNPLKFQETTKEKLANSKEKLADSKKMIGKKRKSLGRRRFRTGAARAVGAR